MATYLCQCVGMTSLTMKGEKRLEIIQRVFRGELTMVEAGLKMWISITVL
jgi:hypothetical protein